MNDFRLSGRTAGGLKQFCMKIDLISQRSSINLQ